MWIGIGIGIGRARYGTGGTPTQLLLDAYTGAAAAYSLRKLRADYTGDAIQVRRASDNSEQDIGFVNNELDTASLTSFCSGTNGFVTTWYDQSGNSNDATQATAASQPQIVSSGSVITENGKPAVYFNGSGGSGSASSYYLASSSLVDVTNDLSIFSVITPTENPASQDAVWTQLCSESNSANNYMAYGFRSGGYFTRQRTTATLILNGLDTTSQSQTLISDVVDWSAETNTFKANGTTGTDLNTGRSQTVGTNTIIFGARTDGVYSVNMNLQEFVFWDSDQSSNRTGIETNINAQYNIYWDGSQTSLLDTYSGSAAAYSLRALSSSYTGALIEVRRASDNATTDIYAKYDGSLNVDALESFCSGTNGFVTTWYDQSGNGNDATQTTASAQPQIVSSGSVLTENGKPAIDFDGSNDFLNAGDILSGESILNIFSIFNVQRTGFEPIIVKGIGAVGTREYGLFGDEFLNVFDESTDTNVTVNTNISINNQYSVYFGYDTSNVFVGLNNGTNNTASIGSVVVQNTTSDLKFGTNVSNNSFALMTMQEAIFYPSDQSSNRTGIETNINDFYSIYYVSPDADAQAFFDRVTTAGGTLSVTEKNAVNTLVVQMKDDGIWSKMKAIYPMVGASAASCAQNLKSSSFTGSFTSGWSFASTGVTPNGTSAYMDTGLNNSTELTVNSGSFGVYLDTFVGEDIPVLMGDGSGNFLGTWQVSRFPNTTGIGTEVVWNSGFASSQYLGESEGFYQTYRNSSTTIQFRGNNTLLSYSKNSVSLVNRTFKLGAFDNNGSFSNFQKNEARFFYIGDGLTDTEASNFYTAVQAFQTTLGREV